MANKIWLGTALLLVILTASFYILMPDKVRIDFEKTRTIFKVYEDGKFVISGIEYVRLFDGTTLMRANYREIKYIISDNESTYVERESYFKDMILVEEVYKFSNNVYAVENIPVSHKICIANANNKIFEYMIDKITYEGVTKDISSPFSFGKNMKLTFQDGYYRAKVYNYKYASDKIKIRYRITEDYQCFDVRLFDPEKIVVDIPKLETVQDCETEFWDYRKFSWNCTKVWHEKNSSWGNYCIHHYDITRKNKTTCKPRLYKGWGHTINASEWCCNQGGLCDSILRDGNGDCKPQSGEDYLNLKDNIIKIDDKDTKNYYHKKELKLEVMAIQ